MNTLPNEAKFHKRTQEFNEATVPAGLLGRHTTAADVWGRIVVVEGNLTFRLLEPREQDYVLDVNHSGIAEPQRAHQVAVDGPVKFYVEFYRV